MTEPLTDFERLLAMQFDLNTWLELNPCTCHALCVCDSKEDSQCSPS